MLREIFFRINENYKVRFSRNLFLRTVISFEMNSLQRSCKINEKRLILKDHSLRQKTQLTFF